MSENDTMPTLDVERLRRVVAHVKELARIQQTPGYIGDVWNQGVWRSRVSEIAYTADPNRCGTAMCLAGWTVELDAIDRRLPSPWAFGLRTANPDQVWSTALEIERANGDEYDNPHVSYDVNWAGTDDKTGEEKYTTPAALRAQYLLGLTDTEASILFHEIETDLGDLDREVERVIEGLYR